MFEKYSAYLNEDFSPDYWSDEGMSHASEILKEFNDNDWELLERIIKEKPVIWLIRCAETLGETSNKKSFNVLLKLISTDKKEVIITALDSISSLISSGHDIGENVEKIHFAITEVKTLTGNVVSIVLGSLQKKLK